MRAYPAGNLPFSVTTGDLNGDNFPDIIVTNVSSKTVTLLLDIGDGTFSPPAGASSNVSTYAVGTAPTSVVAADINGDGVLDIVTANLVDNTISLLLGGGNSILQPQTTTPTAAQPYGLTVADFNNDGKPDLAVAFYEDYTGVLLQKP